MFSTSQIGAMRQANTVKMVQNTPARLQSTSQEGVLVVIEIVIDINYAHKSKFIGQQKLQEWRRLQLLLQGRHLLQPIASTYAYMDYLAIGRYYHYCCC
jgi:hypothetical protein